MDDVHGKAYPLLFKVSVVIISAGEQLYSFLPLSSSVTHSIFPPNFTFEIGLETLLS